MKTIGAGALPRQVPQVLDAVEAGERYTITRRSEAAGWKDVPVAMLLPTSSFSERLHPLSQEDLDILLDLLIFCYDESRGLSHQMANRAREIHDRLQGELA